ncbi:hypothetical protein [Sulfitobacter sp. DSM 110093]|uniref:DUF7282 domain-containing protein n=1 Tax=Sulfitobacter sp. DSM 110093 TaxID=2883127 RepID=UPI001FAB6472|nr:hypothetical protein [Sulfitobacter sp. DSM 110093]
MTSTLIALAMVTGGACADAYATAMAEASDDNFSDTAVSAEKVIADKNGWLVMYRTDEEMKPDAVIGVAPLRAGEAEEIAPVLQNEVEEDDMVMMTVQPDDNAKQNVFDVKPESKDGEPNKLKGTLVMRVVSVE